MRERSVCFYGILLLQFSFRCFAVLRWPVQWVCGLSGNRKIKMMMMMMMMMMIIDMPLHLRKCVARFFSDS